MEPSISLGELPLWMVLVFTAFAAMQIALDIYALVVLFRMPEEQVVFKKRWPWVLIILLVNFVGAIAFLAAGRMPPAAIDPVGDPLSTTPSVSHAERAVDVLYGSTDDARRSGDR